MNNNILLVFWDVCFEVGQGRKYAKPSMLRSHGDMSRSTVQACLKSLVELGLICRVGHGRYTIAENSPFVCDVFDAVRAVSQ